MKEASGNITQICEICQRVPARLHRAVAATTRITLPAMAVGARGIISVASNEVPAEMVRMVEAAERGDFAGARAHPPRLLPLMLVNFAESNPSPVKAAMALMGLLEETYRLPMVPPRADDARAGRPRPASSLGLLPEESRDDRATCTRCERDIEPLVAAGTDADRGRGARGVRALRPALSAGGGPRGRAGRRARPPAGA